MRALVSAWMIGILLGAGFMTPFTTGRVEELELARRELELRLRETQATLEQLQAQYSKRWRPLVRSVTIRIEGVPQASQRIEIKRILQPLAQEMVGKEVAGLDPSLLRYIFEGRLLEVGDKRYLTSLKLAVIGEEITLVISAGPMPASQ